MAVGYATVNGLLPKRWIGASLVIAGCVAFCLTEYMNPFGPRFILYGMPALAIVVGLLSLEKSGINFSFRRAIFVGDSSYAIYLFHGFIISFCVRFSSGSTLRVIILSVAGAIILGGLVRIGVERPLSGMLNRLRAPFPVPALDPTI
jgi:exopolysaccharide production protein ExoZ